MPDPTAGGSPAIRTADPLSLWPALPSDGATALIAQLYRLERSEWLPAEAIAERQFAQLGTLLAHAWRTVPFYQERLAAVGWRPGSPATPALLSRLAPLTRQDIQQADAALHSREPPKRHGKSFMVRTSGSTGSPVKVLGNPRTQLLFGALSLRNQGWHRRDLSLKLCTIKDLERPTDPAKAATFDYPHGIVADDWTGHLGMTFQTGPAAALHIHTPVDQQAEWLQRHDPGHLMTFPSNLMALLQHCRTAGITYPRLRSIWTLGEIVTPELRELAREVLGLPITDVYSSVEVGYIALQCPERPHYHVQSEGVLVEVIDDSGQPCRPGEVGRVIVTPLHNFAMPMLRYVIGDYAEVGEPCPCGRGLPVLSRVLGRTRNMLILPSGRRIWPLLEGALFADVAPVSQFQIVQHSPSLLEVRLVVSRPVTPAEEDALGAMIRRHLEHPYTIAFTYPASIPRGPGGKYEDFICKIGA